MKLLLTSAGIKNASIRAALLELLGKPIAECHALCIPTAMHGHPWVKPQRTWEFVSGRESRTPMVELGWASVGVLELTALPSLDRARWEPWLREADVLLVGGGDALYLAHWIRRSGLAELLPTLDAVWVGLSAGSMVMAPQVGRAFIGWKPPAGDECAGGGDRAHAENWAAGLTVPAYALDDETALRVVDGQVDVISEGHWHHFPR